MNKSKTLSDNINYLDCSKNSTNKTINEHLLVDYQSIDLYSNSMYHFSCFLKLKK